MHLCKGSKGTSWERKDEACMREKTINNDDESIGGMREG
jgi:hypothetical protein